MGAAGRRRHVYAVLRGHARGGHASRRAGLRCVAARVPRARRGRNVCAAAGGYGIGRVRPLRVPTQQRRRSRYASAWTRELQITSEVSCGARRGERVRTGIRGDAQARSGRG